MFDPLTLVGLHTWLSLIALCAGLALVIDLIRGTARPGWTAVFLLTAVATSATGFALPFTGIMPSHIVGGLALVVLAAALLALYGFRLAGAWRSIYVVTAIISVYLLAFVAVAQAFLKIPSLKGLAASGSEIPFALAQLTLLAIFVALGVMAVRMSRRPLAPGAYA